MTSMTNSASSLSSSPQPPLADDPINDREEPTTTSTSATSKSAGISDTDKRLLSDILQSPSDDDDDDDDEEHEKRSFLSFRQSHSRDNDDQQEEKHSQSFVNNNNNNNSSNTSSSSSSSSIDKTTLPTAPSVVESATSNDTPSNSSAASTTTATTPPQEPQEQQHPYNTMLQMTLELVHDIITVRVGDTVMTAFGQGQVLHRGESLEIQLEFGKLYVRTHDMIHKVLPEDEYDAAMDQLEQARKLQIASKCQTYNLPMVDNYQEQACVACLFRTNNFYQNTAATAVTPTTNQKKKLPSEQQEQENDTKDNGMKKSHSTGSITTTTTTSNSNSVTNSPKSPNNRTKSEDSVIQSPKADTATAQDGTTNETTDNNKNNDKEPQPQQQQQQQQQQPWWRRAYNFRGGTKNNNSNAPTEKSPKDDQEQTAPSSPTPTPPPPQPPRGTLTPPNNKNAKKKTNNYCQVCGNPVCYTHSKKTSATTSGARGGTMLFCMCIDCSLDLHSLEHQLNPHHPELVQTLQRLVYYYTRMLLQLSFCLPRLQELACHLTQSEQRHSQISLGTSGLGFVGAALGVAGTAAMFTPAGPAIILAAIATSATSGTLQMTHAGYKSLWSNQTTAHQLADKVIGWHGLCLGILQALEQLRMDLLTEQRLTSLSSSATSFSRRALLRHKHSNAATSNIWNTLAVGGFTTSRHAMTGVSVTSAMGASYSQAINTSLQGIPVVGAAFSVGCMAMDAHNIQSSLRQLQKPSSKANALKQVQDSFLVHVPNTIMEEVMVLNEAVQDLNLRILQQTKERDLEDEMLLLQKQQQQEQENEEEASLQKEEEKEKETIESLESLTIQEEQKEETTESSVTNQQE